MSKTFRPLHLRNVAIGSPAKNMLLIQILWCMSHILSYVCFAYQINFDPIDTPNIPHMQIRVKKHKKIVSYSYTVYYSNNQL